jgi:hypothetical protein
LPKEPGIYNIKEKDIKLQMCHTQFKKQKIIWTLSSIFVQEHPADFFKNTSNEKHSNSPL